METFHAPVMADKAVEYLKPENGKTIVDCTLGGGGHTLKLKAQNPKLKVIGIDQDEEALCAAEDKLSDHQNIRYIHDNFSNISKIIDDKVDGFLFDLGVSSHQIDEAKRGFSFRFDAPLDMRMDKRQTLNAADIVNSYSQEELERVFREFGEERFAKRVSSAICDMRGAKKIETTFQLKEIIEKAIPIWRKRESVARVFQALRIAVNSELENLKKALESAVSKLNKNGKIVVISYHSLEDRIVKWFFREKAKSGILKVLTKKPVLPTKEEIMHNPRAGSAKLRCAEKI